MLVVAIFSNVLMGYGSRRVKAGGALMMVLPLVYAITFLLLSDVDSPRGGIIRVAPHNLTRSLPPK
jgi:hypothetical protein